MSDVSHPHIPETYAALADLAIALDAAPLTKYAGCWETAFPGDDGKGEWFVACHAKKGEEIACSRGPKVPAFTFYVEWNGWPAGFIDPADGMFADGAVANEESFLAAIQVAASVKHTKETPND